MRALQGWNALPPLKEVIRMKRISKETRAKAFSTGNTLGRMFRGMHPELQKEMLIGLAISIDLGNMEERHSGNVIKSPTLIFADILG